MVDLTEADAMNVDVDCYEEQFGERDQRVEELYAESPEKPAPKNLNKKQMDAYIGASK